MSDDAALQPAVAAELEALASVLDVFTAEQWDAPSLCAGWRTREVVAHMTMAARYSEEDFRRRLSEHGFDFAKLSDAIAEQDAALPEADLIACLRSATLQHWAPPGGGFHGALNHAVIHGLDVTVPLGVPRTAPMENLRIVLDGLTRGGGHRNFGIEIDGRRLEAIDLDWFYGEGPELRGPAGDLALTLAGRVVPARRLDGAPLVR